MTLDTVNIRVTSRRVEGRVETVSGSCLTVRSATLWSSAVSGLLPVTAAAGQAWWAVQRCTRGGMVGVHTRVVYLA